MARPVDPNARYRVKPHVTNGHTYASTQPPLINPDTGEKVYRYVHWGKVDEFGKFFPGNEYYLASPEVREKLIFPADWDISEALKLTRALQPKGEDICNYDCQNRLYGDIWLLEQIALKTGIRQDLEMVFNGDTEKVDDILTLAMFPYVTNYNFSRIARWQRIAKAPSANELSSTQITRLTQSITEQHRMDLLALRGAKLEIGEFCAVDSTTRSAYGRSLVDIRQGKNKGGLKLEQTTEVVVYSLSSHAPVYYRTFPGNMPDSRTIDAILTDLDHAGFKNLVLVTERGYDSLGNLDTFISRGQSLSMCVETEQKDIKKIINNFKEFRNSPPGMVIDADSKLYYSQHIIEHDIVIKKINKKVSKKLFVNLYFDHVRRSQEVMEIDISITSQKNTLNELLNNKTFIDDIPKLKKDNHYHNIIFDKKMKVVNSFTLNSKKVEKEYSRSGFFSIINFGINLDPMTTLQTYRLREEQEKYFQQMKEQMGADRQRNWSENGKTGRLFILFVSLVLSSHVRHIWKSTDLHKLFSSSLDIIDEMKSIRCIEHTAKTIKITPFTGAQLDICDAFGFEIPDGCAPVYRARRILKR